MPITLLPIAGWSGVYNTTSGSGVATYTPLIVYPNGRVTLVGQEVIYNFNPTTNHLSFDKQTITGVIVAGDFVFAGSGTSKTFSGTLTEYGVTEKEGSFTGTQGGSPLASWIGSYTATASTSGAAFSPFVVHPTGEVTIASDRVEYQYDIITNSLVIEATQVGTATVQGTIQFAGSPDSPTFSGTITASVGGPEQTYTGTHAGMPLSYWANYYSTLEAGGTSLSPLIVHNNDTIDIAGQRLNFDYDMPSNTLTFAAQDINGTEVEGSITFAADGNQFSFAGTVTLNPPGAPVSYTGKTGETYNVLIANNRSGPVAVYAMTTTGQYLQAGSLATGTKMAYSAYQGQQFLAVEGTDVFSGFYAYPGFAEWHLNSIPENDALLPSIVSAVAANFNVINHLSTYLEIYKIDESGDLIFHTTIPAKRQFVVESNENDHWVVVQQGRVIDDFYGSLNKSQWVVEATSHPAFAIDIPANGNLTAPNIAGYSVGTGDFTVISMVQPKKAGTIISKKGTAGGAGNGGFLVVVKPDQTIKFATDNGSGFYEVNSVATDILNGECHSVAAVRKSGTLSIYLDGIALPVTPRSNLPTPLNIDNSLALMLGATEQSQEPYNQYTGLIMNAGFWSRALSTAEIAVAQFGKTTEVANGLQGFWTLNYTLEDVSANHNRLTSTGNVSFASCFNCIWAYGENSYVFCQMENPQNNLIDIQQVTRKRVMSVPAGAPSLMASIIDNSMDFNAPANTTLKITAPDGTVYNTETNTADLYAHLEGDCLVALTVTNPAAGEYTIEITAQSNTPFNFQFQTVPSSDVVTTTMATLGPLFPNPPTHDDRRVLMSKNLELVSLSSGWGWFAAVVAVVVVTAVVAVVVAASGGTALAVAGAAVGAFAISSNVALTYMTAQSDDVQIANRQGQGTGGYIPSTKSLLLIDADADADPATQLIYEARKKFLYPYVDASKYLNRQACLIGANDKKVKVTAALKVAGVTYCTASGHGRPSYLMGWYVSGSGGPFEEVMNNKTTPEEAANKIIHIFGCHTGYVGNIGLGQKLVTKGTTAFFGYSDVYKLSTSSPGVTTRFCKCDMEIDNQLIDGADADTAYNRSLAMYSLWVTKYRNGHIDPNVAVQLEHNQKCLVSPSTNAAYGSKSATL